MYYQKHYCFQLYSDCNFVFLELKKDDMYIESKLEERVTYQLSLGLALVVDGVPDHAGVDEGEGRDEALGEASGERRWVR